MRPSHADALAMPAALADPARDRVEEAIAAASEGALVLVHGGPLTTPESVHAALAACPEAVGSFGASTIERLPIERAVRAATAAFKGDASDEANQ